MARRPAHPNSSDLRDRIRSLLSGLRVASLRLHLRSDEPMTAPRLRGVWGRALHSFDGRLYDSVFRPRAPAVPRYVIRPADTGDALDFLVFGEAVDSLPRLLRAWDVASGMGLGRGRTPFAIEGLSALDPDGPADTDWTRPRSTLLSSLAVVPPGALRLVTTTPLRFVRKARGSELLDDKPSLSRIATTLIRRIAALAEIDPDSSLLDSVTGLCRGLGASAMLGQRCTLLRYSATQKSDLELLGVMGSMAIPAGAEDLLPLLAAADWVHTGKATIVGLGRLGLSRD